MIIPSPPKGPYEAFLRILSDLVNAADMMNRKKMQDVEIAPAERLIISSPDGTRFKVVISNAGVVSGTPL